MKTSSCVLRTQGQSMTGGCHKFSQVFEKSSKDEVKKPREPDDDWQEKERLVEEAVERLDIVIVDSDPRLLLELVRTTFSF